METTITVTEFKAKCSGILDRLADRTCNRVIVTKRGRAVAILTPPEAPAVAIGRLHGFMRNSAIIPEGFDFTAPVLDAPLFADGGQIPP